MWSEGFDENLAKGCNGGSVHEELSSDAQHPHEEEEKPSVVRHSWGDGAERQTHGVHCPPSTAEAMMHERPIFEKVESQP